MRGFVEIEHLTRAEAEIERLGAESAMLGELQSRFALTLSEARLLCALYAGRKRVASRDLLSDAAGATGSSRLRQTIDTWVCRIRRKIGADSIETLYGAGYRLTPSGVALLASVVTPTVSGEAA